jgi:hypothetical protein
MSNIVVAPPDGLRYDIKIPVGSAQYQERIVRFIDDLENSRDISAWVFRLDIRREYDSTVLVSCEAGDGLIINLPLASVTIDLDSAALALLPTGRYSYDLRVVRPAPAPEWLPVYGYVNITPHITR